MILKNTTNIHDKTIKDIIKAVCPKSVKKIICKIKFKINNRCSNKPIHGARTLTYGPLVNKSYKRNRIVNVKPPYKYNHDIRVSLPINDSDVRMYKYTDKTIFGHRLIFKPKNRIEYLLYGIAHELKHIEQCYRKIHGDLTWGELYKQKSQYFEYDAYKYSYKMLKLYRKGKILRNHSSND